jgi:hypothetical protein
MADWRWALALVLVLLAAGTVIALRRRTAPQAPPAPRDETDAVMVSLADEAVSRARSEFQQSLDFAPESIRTVEQILGKVYDLRAAGQLTDDRLHREALTWGTYIGEVIRRQKGGHWEKDHAVGGPDSYPLHHGGGQSFPVAWCGKRLINGDEDNVWFKYQVMTARKD